MRVADYDRHVQASDQYLSLPMQKRREIAIYGIASEIGSLVSAIKKDSLSEAGAGGHYAAEAEVAEEIGDIIWYCFSLSQIENAKRPVDILAADIALLKSKLSAQGQAADLFRAALAPGALQRFLQGAEKFPRLRNLEFDAYQTLAFSTARTKEDELVRVCLSVLWQLGAELMRKLLPDSERKINTTLPDRTTNEVLGEIAWHIAAIASVYKLSLNQVIQQNVTKIHFRTSRSNSTPRHDAEAPEREQFPRHLQIQFVTVAHARSRMYLNGKQVGDDLTDNTYEADGYRFHDVMHLANVAYLGWSPVFRSLLKRKRKSDPRLDEVEDGARAKIVEEAVLKTIHSQGKKRAQSAGLDPNTARLFSDRQAIPFSLLKFIRGMVEGLEVARNTYWEWEDAIYNGYKTYHALREHGQGTVIINLDTRSLEFSPNVVVELNGVVAGIGATTLTSDATEHPEFGPVVGLLSSYEIEAAKLSEPALSAAAMVAAKAAVLESLGLEPKFNLFDQLRVTPMPDRRLSIKATGIVQDAIWERRVVTFKSTFTRSQKSVSCSILAVGDPSDSMPKGT